MAEQETSPEKIPEEQEDKALQEASKSTADYAQFEPPKKQRNPIWRKLGLVAAALAILAGLAAGAYWLISNRKSAGESTKNSPSSQSETSQAVTADQITIKTKHYVSQSFRLEFDYPKDWKVTDVDGSVMIVESPLINLKKADGQAVSGFIVVTFQAKPDKFPSIDPNNATAERTSVKLDYEKPSPSQRGSTFESFLRYPQSTKGLDAVYITGDSGYTKDQAIPTIDIKKVDPVISITFFRCDNGDCEGRGDELTISSSSWDNKTFSEPLENIFKSLTIN